MSGNISKGLIGEQDLHRWDGTSDKDFTRDTSTGGTITLNDFGHEVDCLISYGAGVNYTLATITSALTAIGTTNKVGLILRPGTWTITNDLTITSNITLLPAPGCKFTVSAGKTATIQGPVEAGAYQWIYGDGTTTISTYPQDQAWWGNAERLDVTGLKVGSAVMSAFVQTLIDDANAATARATLGVDPPGSILFWPTETPPTGYLECDGASLDRTTYAALFAVIGTMYGTADGTHFNLPDYRGRFLRSWAHGSTNDPDRAARTAPTATGATIVAGDHVGTEQADAFELHHHTESTIGGGTGYTTGPSWNFGPVETDTGDTGGNETRPINVNVMYCIKY